MLISVDDNGNLKTMDEGLKFLEQCAKPIRLISVCGVAREGKSALCTMLMRFLADTPENMPSPLMRFSTPPSEPSDNSVISPDASSGGESSNSSFCFDIGSGTRACTDGAWMWATPWESGSIVILDSQGLSKGNTEGVRRLFSTLALCSSVLVLNVMRQLNDDSLSKLNVLAALSTMVKSEAHEVSNQMEMPALAILLRDMDLDITEDGFKDLNSWMEATLSGATGGDVQQVTEAIRNDFSQRQMLAMESPARKDKQFLKDIANGQQNGVMCEGHFKDSFLKVAAVLLETAKQHPKKLKGDLLNGAQMCALVQSIVDAANGTQVDIQSGARMIMRGAANDMINQYEYDLQTMVHDLEALLPMLDMELDTSVNVVKTKVLDGFKKALEDEQLSLDEALKTEYRNDMYNKVKLRLDVVLQTNSRLQITELNHAYNSQEAQLNRAYQKLDHEWQQGDVYNSDFNAYRRAHDAISTKQIAALKERLESFAKPKLVEEQVDKLKVIAEGHLSGHQIDQKLGDEWRQDELKLTPTMQNPDLSSDDGHNNQRKQSQNGIDLAGNANHGQANPPSRRKSTAHSHAMLKNIEEAESESCCRCTLL